MITHQFFNVSLFSLFQLSLAASFLFRLMILLLLLFNLKHKCEVGI